MEQCSRADMNAGERLRGSVRSKSRVLVRLCYGRSKLPDPSSLVAADMKVVTHAAEAGWRS